MRCAKACAVSFCSYLLVFLSFHFPTPTAGDPRKLECSQIPANGTFAVNRGLALSSLPPNASAATTRFSNLTIGEIPDRVYGLAQCRGDTNSDVCLDCLKTAGEEFPAFCPNRTGFAWYDNCFMRYSDTPILPTSNNGQYVYIWITQNVSDPSTFNRILGEMMKGLISKAADAPSGTPLYAKDRAYFSSFETVYGLAQCGNNLVGSDCSACLEDAVSKIPECCQGKRGGIVIGVNCNIRFELYRFYEDSAAKLDPLAAEPLATDCADTYPLYNADDPFGANLKSLLASFTSEAALTGFNVSDVGENPNQVHGLFLCRADVTPDNCGNCINTTSQRLLANCSRRSAAMWYDNCYLRYSYQQILPSPTNAFVYNLWPRTNESSGETSSPRSPKGAWEDALRDLAMSAANHQLMFAAQQLQPSTVKEGNISLYGLMQCTRDLSPDACRDCLMSMKGELKSCCHVEEGGNLLGSSCDLRVQKTKFYNDTNLPAAGDSILPTPGSGRSSSRTTTIIVAVAVPIAILAALFAMVVCFRRRT